MMNGAKSIHVCSCGLAFTADEWRALPLVGTQEIVAGPRGEPPERLQLKNCPSCQSTRAVCVEVFSTEAGGWAYAGDVGEYLSRAAS